MIPDSSGLVRDVLFVSVLLVLAVWDLRFRLLPNLVVIPAGAVGLLVSSVAGPGAWWVYPASAFGVGGGLLLVAGAYPGGMGMGDVKMGCMLGAFLGPFAFVAVFLGALFGSVVGCLLLCAGLMGRRAPLPFGAFMSLGGLVSLLFGPELWAWYLNIFR